MALSTVPRTFTGGWAATVQRRIQLGGMCDDGKTEGQKKLCFPHACGAQDISDLMTKQLTIAAQNGHPATNYHFFPDLAKKCYEVPPPPRTQRPL